MSRVLATLLKKLYPKLKNLINIRHNKELIEAVNELRC